MPATKAKKTTEDAPQTEERRDPTGVHACCGQRELLAGYDT